MNLVAWTEETRKGCNQWADFFCVVAGDANPVSSLVGEKALEWGAFLKKNFAPLSQRKLLAVTDESVRAQVVRAIQGVLTLHKRLAAAAEAENPAEVSEVMLSIDSALQQLAEGLNRIIPSNVDESILDNLPDLPPNPDNQVTRPSPGRTAAEKEQDAAAKRQLREGSGSRRTRRPGSGSGVRPGSGSGVRPGSDSGVRPGSGSGVRPGSGSGVRTRPSSASGVRPSESQQSTVPPPRRSRSAGLAPTPPPRKASKSTGPSTLATPSPSAPQTSPSPPAGGFKRELTQEDQVIPLTQKKGESGLIRLPTDGDHLNPSEYDGSVEPKRTPAGSSSPLRPAALDPRVALLRTYVKRLDREVLGPEEDAALEQVLAILSGALSSSEETLARRFRFLDQQFAADEASLFSKPLLKDLRGLLSKMSNQATARLATACDQAQTDRLLFIIGDVEIRNSPDDLPAVGLALSSAGLRAGLLPSYLPRLRGPSAGFTFHVGTKKGATIIQPVPENRLEFGFIASATRLWLTAFHVLRLGSGGALNIEPTGDDLPAYFEARLTLPATDETYAVAQRFVLAETARFVDRIVCA
jgi:hypothetical protein